MELFYRDALLLSEVSWHELIEDLNNAASFNSYCYSKNYYTVFKQILLSIILKKEIVLLDSDFTTDELVNLTGFSDFGSFEQLINKKDFELIQSKTHLIDRIKKSSTEWKITLFTSGTTGIPKKVSHRFESITRFVKTTTSENIWGFAYNPTHFAGLQVFFQAILNGNTIVRLFDLEKEQIINEIQNYSITHISATPSFFRLLLPLNKNYGTVKRITSGGEKFDKKTIQQLKPFFPNAKITNIYASTEAGSLFASEGDIFTLKPEVEKWVKIVNGELFIHHHLMGESASNAEEWYASGDLVAITDTNPLQFRFVSRKNEMINSGGYKVNPVEVEEVIRGLKGITDVRVYGKPNAVLGNIICCEVQKNNPQLDETTIRMYLQTKLQEFKIPRMIYFVDGIQTTRSGKIKR
ncbi:MAG: fatty acid--CoA ligase family protein [Bacteroidetes bacterium]|nr:fatty acid--CoA ligase family protein [Bacteroidota bacterium]